MGKYLETFNSYHFEKKHSPIDAVLMTINDYYTKYQSEWVPTSRCPTIERDPTAQHILRLFHDLNKLKVGGGICFSACYFNASSLKVLEEVFQAAAIANGEFKSDPDYTERFKIRVQSQKGDMVNVLCSELMLYRNRYIIRESLLIGKKDKDKIEQEDTIKAVDQLVAHLELVKKYPIGDLLSGFEFEYKVPENLSQLLIAAKEYEKPFLPFKYATLFENKLKEAGTYFGNALHAVI